MLSRRAMLLSAVALAWASVSVEAAQSTHRPVPPPATAAKPTAEAATPTSPAQTPVGPVDTAAHYAVIIDYNTGATLLDKDADVQMTPSSMTKLMTAYIVYGMLKSGRLKLDQDLPVSERAWRMGGSKMFVQIGTQVKVEDLIRGMIVQSGNDACIVLAEGIAGSEEQFVELMNAKAKELGLTNSNFRNTTGWPDPEHKMSARDIATLARRHHPGFPRILSLQFGKELQVQQYRPGKPQPAGAEGPGGRFEDRPYRGSRLRPGGQRAAQRAARHPGVERPGHHAPARRGERAPAGMVVPRIRGRDPVHRRRHH